MAPARHALAAASLCALHAGAAAAQIIQEPPNIVWRTIEGQEPFTRALVGPMIAEGVVEVPVGAIQNPEWVRARLRDLDADDIDRRDRATAELAAAGLTPELAAELAASPDVTPEARERLLTAARFWFENTERAAMGVSFDTSRIGEPVDARVGGAIDGFDAKRVLQPGDLITEVNGRPVNYQELRAHIVSHDPGQTCQITILRAGRPIKASITFGRWSQLSRSRGGASALDDRVLSRAFSLRLERAGLTPEQPVSTGLDRNDWELVTVRLARQSLDSGQDADLREPPDADDAPVGLRHAGQGPVWDGLDAADPSVWRDLSAQDLLRQRRALTEMLRFKLAQAENGGRDAADARLEADAIFRQLSIIESELQRRRAFQP